MAAPPATPFAALPGSPSRTHAAFSWCFNCGDLDEPYALPLALHPKEHMARHLCDACRGAAPEPRSAYDFCEGAPVPGQGFALGALHPGCPPRRANRERKAAVFLAPDGASVVKVVPLLHPAGARVEGEVALQRAAGALGLAPAVRGVTFSRAFAFVTMERVHGDMVADLHGEAEADVPPPLAVRVRAALRALADARIEYPDAQPYNFLVDAGTGRVVVIDFEHARERALGDPRLAQQGVEGAGPLWREL